LAITEVLKQLTGKKLLELSVFVKIGSAGRCGLVSRVNEFKVGQKKGNIRR